MDNSKNELCLITSTFQLNCTNCVSKIRRKVRNTLVAFTMKHFHGWRQDVMPSRDPTPIEPHTITMTIPEDLLDRAKSNQQHTNAYMKKHEKVCNTPFLELAEVQKMLDKMKFPIKVTQHMTMGGISRIYKTDQSDKIVKVTLAVDTVGYGRYEKKGYELLNDASIPAAKVLYVGIEGKFLILVIENLCCSLGSILRSSSLADIHTIQEVIKCIKDVLGMLLYSGLVFIDLSPDNIMYDEKTNSLKLIDAQFVIHKHLLTDELGLLWTNNIDTISIALRILALGMLHDSREDTKTISRIMCASILEKKCPKHLSVIRWLKHDMPMMLTTSFALQQKNL
jgi:hypothetical protein